MYLIPVEIRESKIEGKGVFATDAIANGTIVWKFVSGYDMTMSIDDALSASDEVRAMLEKVAYISKTTKRYVYPPENDIALYTNHSDKNNLSVMYDEVISEEPFFVANRNIEKGEEITNNYYEFDEVIKIKKQKFLR